MKASEEVNKNNFSGDFPTLSVCRCYWHSIRVRGLFIVQVFLLL